MLLGAGLSCGNLSFTLRLIDTTTSWDGTTAEGAAAVSPPAAAVQCCSRTRLVIVMDGHDIRAEAFSFVTQT